MGASQINKPKLEQTTWTATVAEGLLEEANVCAWRPKKITSTETCSFPMLKSAQFPGGCFTAGLQYPTAIVPIEPFQFPISCSAVFVLLIGMTM